MTRQSLLLTAALGLVLAAGNALAQAPKEPTVPAPRPAAQPAPRPAENAPQPGALDEEAMMKKWTDANTPGPMHEILTRSAGTWDARVKSWMAPGVPPSESTGSATVTVVLHGRFTLCEYSGSMGPLPFTGVGYYGYNNATKKFESTWLDSLSTGMMLMTGSYDESKKEMTWTGTTTDPLDNKVKIIRSVEKTIDSNTMTLEMYGPDADGKEFKTLEIRYIRTGGVKPEVPVRNPRPLPAEKTPAPQSPATPKK